MVKISHFGVALLVLGLSACGGGDGGAVFEFRLHNGQDTEAFWVKITDPAVIKQAQEQLEKPVAERLMFPVGFIQSGNGGVNKKWSWHFVEEVALGEMAMEVCDSLPSGVESHLTYWLKHVKTFCPWDAYVYAEMK